MNDKELLELAAKAAGIELKPIQVNNVTKQGDDRFIGYMTNLQEWSRGWFNPLTDDGDALRLAVKLKMYVCVGTHTVTVEIFSEAEEPSIFQKVFIEVDEYAATRRAIVRAAAEIGKNK